MRPETRKEGHWRWAMEPNLPMPEPDADWPGRDAFLPLLHRLEDAARETHFKGFSTCRLCGRVNGSSSFTLDGWEWPSGFAHYLEDHGVRPTADFEAFVLARAPSLGDAASKGPAPHRLPSFPPRGPAARRFK